MSPSRAPVRTRTRCGRRPDSGDAGGAAGVPAGRSCRTGWPAGVRPDRIHSGAALLDWPRLLPRVDLFLHLAEETVQAARAGSPDGVVRWEGEGPVTVQYVREQLAPYHAFTITPVVDLAGQEPVDSL